MDTKSSVASAAPIEGESTNGMMGSGLKAKQRLFRLKDFVDSRNNHACLNAWVFYSFDF